LPFIIIIGLVGRMNHS